MSQQEWETRCLDRVTDVKRSPSGAHVSFVVDCTRGFCISNEAALAIGRCAQEGAALVPEPEAVSVEEPAQKHRQLARCARCDSIWTRGTVCEICGHDKYIDTLTAFPRGALVPSGVEVERDDSMKFCPICTTWSVGDHCQLCGHDRSIQGYSVRRDDLWPAGDGAIDEEGSE